MNSWICQFTIFAIRHGLDLKASILEMIMCCMHSPSLFSWSISNSHIYSHYLRMTEPKNLKLSILALQSINRKSIKNKEYLWTGYAFEICKWKLGKLLAKGQMTRLDSFSLKYTTSAVIQSCPPLAESALM